MQAADSPRARRPTPRRRVVAVASDVAEPEADHEVTLEAFRQLLVELTGHHVGALDNATQQTHSRH